MKIEIFKNDKMDNLSYLIFDCESRICAVIDPSWSYGEISSFIKKKKLLLKAIFLTHGHYDHCDMTFTLENVQTDFYVGQEDIFLMPSPPKKYLPLKDELEISLCPKIKIKCIHTPGHSQGSYCFLCDKYLFTGDTLFPGCCGRVDLPGSNPKLMRQSLLKLSTLPAETKIYSGHFYNGGQSILEKELKTNPCFLSINNEDSFLNEIL